MDCDEDPWYMLDRDQGKRKFKESLEEEEEIRSEPHDLSWKFRLEVRCLMLNSNQEKVESTFGRQEPQQRDFENQKDKHCCGCHRERESRFHKKLELRLVK